MKVFNSDKGKIAHTFQPLPKNRRTFEYERSYLNYWLDDFPDDGGVFYDIGAGFGYYPLVLSDGYDNPEIVAWEPSPYRFEALKMTRDLNDHDWRIFQKLVADEDGEQKVMIDTKGFVTCREGLVYKDSPKCIVGEKLDHFVDEYALPNPDVVKIDTEGSEGRVMKGGLETLKEADLIQVEIHQFGELGRNIEENETNFIQLISKMGFKVEKRFSDRPQHFLMIKYES